MSSEQKMLANPSTGPLSEFQVTKWNMGSLLVRRHKKFKAFIEQRTNAKRELSDAEMADYTTPCWVARFRASLDPTLVILACDFNFFRTGLVSSFLPDPRPGHKQFNDYVRKTVNDWERDFFKCWRPQAIKHYYLAEGKKLSRRSLSLLRTGCEMCQPNRPARIAYDIDMTNEHPSADRPREFLRYFLSLHMQVMREDHGIDDELPLVCPKSDMTHKKSWHIIAPQFVKDWKRDMTSIWCRLMDLDASERNWLGNGVLDINVYRNFNLFGMVLNCKWKDLKKDPKKPRRLLLDRRCDAVTQYMIHDYSGEPIECLDVKKRVQERFVSKREGSSHRLNAQKVTRKLQIDLKNYNAGPPRFIEQNHLRSLNAVGFFQSVFPSNSHDIFDGSITQCYATMCQVERVTKAEAFDVYRTHAVRWAENTIEGSRRMRRAMRGKQFNDFWRRASSSIERMGSDAAYLQSHRIMMRYANLSLPAGVLEKNVMDEAFGLGPWEDRTQTCECRYITQYVNREAIKTRCCAIKSWMGSGKTTLMLQFFKESASWTRILYVVSSIALAESAARKMRSEGMKGVRNYLWFPRGATSEDRGRVRVYVTTMQSLHKLPSDVSYDYVVFDELVLIVNDCFATTNKRIIENLVLLQTFLDKANQVIACDALMTRRELDFLEIFFKREDISLIHNVWRPGRLGTTKKRAKLYMCNENTGDYATWLDTFIQYIKRHGRSRLTQLFCAPKKDLFKILWNYCQPESAFKVQQFLSRSGGHDVANLIMEFSGHSKKSAPRTLVVSRENKHSAEYLVEMLTRMHVLAHTTALTAGVDLNIPPSKSKLHDIFMLLSWRVGAPQAYLQGSERMRHAEIGHEKCLHVTVKRTGPPPDHYRAPLGSAPGRIWGQSKMSSWLRAKLNDTDERLLNIWGQIENQQAIWVQFGMTAMKWWLDHGEYEVETSLNEPSEVAEMEAPPKKRPRPLASIKDCDSDEFWRMKNLTLEEGSRGKDENARVAKHLFKLAGQQQQKSEQDFVEHLVSRGLAYEGDVFAQLRAEPSDHLQETTEFRFELSMRTTNKWPAPTMHAWAHPLGLDILLQEFKDRTQDKNFQKWTENHGALTNLRMRRAGITPSQEHTDYVMECALQKKTIFGLWHDRTMPQFECLSWFERETTGSAWCEYLQFTPGQVGSILQKIEENMERVKQAFGKVKSKKESMAYFRLMLNLYNLTPVKCRGSERPNTFAINLGVKLPNLRSEQAVRTFCDKLHEQYPILFGMIRFRDMKKTSLVDVAKAFKEQCRTGHWSLKSKFTPKGESNFRVFWNLPSEHITIH